MDDPLSPVFIVGSSRSGTTLLRNLLRSHPNLTFPPESQFIAKYYRAYGDPRTWSEAIRLGRLILATRSVQTWQIDLQPQDFGDCRSFRDILQTLFDSWARRENKPRWGDKTPQYVTDIPLLLNLFPNAQVIHIIRDGRDVASSAVKASFEGNLFMAALRWKKDVEAGRMAGASLSPSTYFEVHYEALLERSFEVMESVCKFLNEPMDQRVLKPSPPMPHPLSTRPWLNAYLDGSNDQIVKSNGTKWRQCLSLSDRSLFEAVAADTLIDLGYETEGLSYRVNIMDRWLWRSRHLVRLSVSRCGALRRPDLIRDYIRFRVADLIAYIRTFHFWWKV
jgi:hypothetical protein